MTYLDADLMFFSDPEALFDEMGDASVLITPHRFAPEYAHHAINGIYNVQFLPFRRDERGLTTLNWWHDRCIEWCYYRLEDGKLGDQKYLDDWPERFPGVHVLQHSGGGLAPWNISQYDVHEGPGGRVLVDDDPLVFFHYHRLQLRTPRRARVAAAGLPDHRAAARARLRPVPCRAGPGHGPGPGPRPGVRGRLHAAAAAS